jgi:hypothetical protein
MDLNKDLVRIREKKIDLKFIIDVSRRETK